MTHAADNSAAPTPSVANTAEQLTEAVEETLRLLRSGRFQQVPAQTARMQALAAEMAQWRGEFVSGPGSSQAAASCEKLQRRTLVLSEVLRHVSGVAAGLGEIRAAATATGYGRDGRSSSSRAGRWSTEV